MINEPSTFLRVVYADDVPPPAITEREKRRGFSLIEVAIVLGVVGLVIGGIWIAAAAMMERWKISHTVEQISFLADCLRNVAVPTEAVSGDSAMNFVRDSGCAPADMLPLRWTGAGKMLTAAYYDMIHVNFIGDGTFRIYFHSQPDDECNITLNALTTKFGNSGNILTRALGGNASGTVWYTASQFPLSISPNKCHAGNGNAFEFSIPNKP